MAFKYKLENRDGAHDLATDLVDLGYREFAVLAGPSDLVTASVRTEGFEAGLADCGIELGVGRLVHGEFTRDGGYAAAGEVLRSMPGVEAIFAVNDVMAVGAMARLREAGLSLPGDIAIAGFDDIATLRDVTPALTTVQLPLERVGRDALDLALAERSDGPVTERIAGRVVIRQSTPRIGDA